MILLWSQTVICVMCFLVENLETCGFIDMYLPQCHASGSVSYTNMCIVSVWISPSYDSQNEYTCRFPRLAVLESYCMFRGLLDGMVK